MKMKVDISKLLYCLSIIPLFFAGVRFAFVINDYAFYAEGFALDFATYLTQFGILIGLGRIVKSFKNR